MPRQAALPEGNGQPLPAHNGVHVWTRTAWPRVGPMAERGEAVKHGKRERALALVLVMMVWRTRAVKSLPGRTQQVIKVDSRTLHCPLQKGKAKGEWRNTIRHDAKMEGEWRPWRRRGEEGGG